MARNKLRDEARKQRAARRDHRREELGGPDLLHDVAARHDTPSQVVALQELMLRTRGLLTEEEMRLAEMRADGLGWPEIAAALNASPEALRKQLTRAIRRIAQQLGLD